MFNDAPGSTDPFPCNFQYSYLNYATDSILSFNEPDICGGGSACMSVSQSVASYRKYIQPYACQVALGSPAVTNSGAPGASLTYLEWFLGNCTGCTVDFVAVHWYSNIYAFDYFQEFVEAAYAAGGNRPLWITEFGMDGTYPDWMVQSFMRTAVSWLDSLEYVARYAWFGAYTGSENSAGADSGMEINEDGTGLSPEGKIFNSYTRGWTNCQNSGYLYC
ncbi:hypothetical protein MMC13_003750 [Lambiella insularis]|nr:hypothetical protein [Lambiella insularis]